MKNKITNRTQVYRAIYYSGFNWSRTISGTNDTYKLVSKTSGRIIYIEHSLDADSKMDILTAKTNDTLDAKELDRFSRLCHKIMRRTKDLGIHQDLIELKEQEKSTETGETND